MITLERVDLATDDEVRDLLFHLSPSGTLLEVAQNAELDHLQDLVDHDLQAAREYLDEGIADRLEDDFARAEPAISDAEKTLEGFWIPVLAGLASPLGAPFVSFGLKVACAVARAALDAWAKRRLAQGGKS